MFFYIIYLLLFTSEVDNESRDYIYSGNVYVSHIYDKLVKFMRLTTKQALSMDHVRLRLNYKNTLLAFKLCQLGWLHFMSGYGFINILNTNNMTHKHFATV